MPHLVTMQASQTGSNFCSIYIDYRHKNGENQYILAKIVGKDRSGKALDLKESMALKKLNGNDLSSVNSEDFSNLLSKCQANCLQKQGNFSLTFSNHDESRGLHHEATLDLCPGGSTTWDTREELIVTLQDASIELLCSDSDDQCIMETKFHTLIQWKCKSLEIADKVSTGGRYIGFTAMGPGFCRVAGEITMVVMRGLRDMEAVEVAALQISDSYFVQCQDEKTLGAEENETLREIMEKPQDLNEIYKTNKSFFFILKKAAGDDTFNIKSALYHKFLCSEGGKLAINETESRFIIKKKK